MPDLFDGIRAPSTLGSNLRPDFIVAGAAGLHDELRHRHLWFGHLRRPAGVPG